MKLAVYNQKGKKIGTEDVPENIFNLPMNDALVYQVFTVKLANRRKNYAHTKTRSEVRGGGRKPWRQKGTGRARHGSIRSPIWKGGGVTFGPRNERVFSKKINKKMNKSAIAVAISAKAREGNIYIIDSLAFEEPKTKFAVSLLEALKVKSSSTLVYGSRKDEYFVRVFKNIPKAKPTNINRINLVDLLNNKNCILSMEALEQLIYNYTDKKKLKTKAA